MFTTAKNELRELLELERKIAAYDATLNADRSIMPEPTATDRRRAWGARAVQLAAKYELLAR